MHFEEFSEAAQVKYLTNSIEKMIICHFDYKYLNLEKTKTDYHSQILNNL